MAKRKVKARIKPDPEKDRKALLNHAVQRMFKTFCSLHKDTVDTQHLIAMGLEEKG